MGVICIHHNYLDDVLVFGVTDLWIRIRGLIAVLFHEEEPDGI